ncbi:VC0807 family protein [Paraburkholderia caribensis]|uniref:VC0807 family protein n=1 Tax=Paraburkholderia caribensis TaxID=75105 RepID=UPI001D0912BD|nr:VC0807 family protein [Paraburkholderia caribensis]
MKVPYRYLSAMVVNLALPWLAYRLALPHWGTTGALAASAAPLIAWIAWDLYHSRHFDALSAIVLAGILPLLAWALIDRGEHRRALEDPMVAAVIGVTFLLSLLLRKPLVYYLARSTASRESREGVEAFERHYRERPALVAQIRRMTLVWGIGLTAENAARYWVVTSLSDAQLALQISTALRWSVYGSLTLWTLWTRRRLKRIDAERKMESA